MIAIIDDYFRGDNGGQMNGGGKERSCTSATVYVIDIYNDVPHDTNVIVTIPEAVRLGIIYIPVADVVTTGVVAAVWDQF